MTQSAAPGANDESLVWGIFVRAVAVCYLVTFLAESRQLLGLVGSHGILPIAEFIDVASKLLSEPNRYLRLPTLFWFNASDLFIGGLPWLGAFAALSALIGVGSRVCLLICYCLHQSTVVAGGDFFFYPWDFLLLETTILSVFVPALRRLPSLSARRPPSRIVAFALLFLLFRLQFGMGLHKFFDATDDGWRDLIYVYRWQQAQPMPTWAAWYAFNYVPKWMHAGMDALTFLAEVPLPFLLFIPGRTRLITVSVIAFMHVGIALLGNFGTFQLVSLTLCIVAVSEEQARALWSWTRRKLGKSAFEVAPAVSPPVSSWQRRLKRVDAFAGASLASVAMLCGVLFTVHMLQADGMTALSNTRWLFAREAERSLTVPGVRLLRLISPFFLSYPYGIFRESAQPDSPRRGIVFQGSDDGVHWRTYENKWNPVEPTRRGPQFFAPYQPRLDHMFIYEAGGFHFAYINGINPYYGSRTPLPFLAQRLFERSADVLSLFATNPFPDHAPAKLRVRFSSYRFSTPEERRASGDWWVRWDEVILGPVEPLGTAALVAAERDVASRALQHAITVEERAHADAVRPKVEPATVDPWMPPWKFWLLAAPGWLPAGWLLALRAVERWRRRGRPA